MSNHLEPLTLDDPMLDAIEEALAGAYTIDDDTGDLTLVGSEFTLTQLLDFYSGVDKSKFVLLGEGDPMGLGIEGAPIYEYPDATYSERDLIAALVAEVRRLREAQGSADAA